MFRQEIIFTVGGQVFGLDGLKVTSVEASANVSYLTGAPACVLGVTDFRGNPVPVIDLYSKFGINGSAPAGSQYLFVNAAIGTLGLPVDAVREIGAVDMDTQMPVPEIAACSGTAFIRSYVSHKGDLVAILDENRILTDSETVRLKTALKGFVDLREAQKQEEIRLMKLKEEAEAKAKADKEAKAKADREARAKAEPKAEAKSKAEPKAEAKSKAEPKAEAKSKAEPKAEARAKAEPKAKARAGAEKKSE